jgi:opacity protein-like surface antigen
MPTLDVSKENAMKNKMNRCFACMITASALATASFAAQAAEPTWFGDQPAKGRWLIGVKTGLMKHEGADIDDATNTGFVFGYTFAKPIGKSGSASIEFEFTDTTDDGVFGADSFVGQPGIWNINTKAVYLAYRSGGTVYLKGKVGAVVGEAKFNTTSGLGDVSFDHAQAAFGAGLGFRITDNFSAEFEYTFNQGKNDINYVSGGLYGQF